jgi:hypothetical protein
MKTKLTFFAIAAITLFSFTFTSSKKVARNQNEVKASQSGFTLQDRNQF